MEHRRNRFRSRDLDVGPRQLSPRAAGPSNRPASPQSVTHVLFRTQGPCLDRLNTDDESGLGSAPCTLIPRPSFNGVPGHTAGQVSAKSVPPGTILIAIARRLAVPVVCTVNAEDCQERGHALPFRANGGWLHRASVRPGRVRDRVPSCVERALDVRLPRRLALADRCRFERPHSGRVPGQGPARHDRTRPAITMFGWWRPCSHWPPDTTGHAGHAPVGAYSARRRAVTSIRPLMK